LALKTSSGQEIKRLPVPDVRIASAGEVKAGEAPRLREQSDWLCARIQAAIETEGLTPVGDALDLAIAVGTAVTAAEDSADVVISLAVKPAGPEGGDGGGERRREVPPVPDQPSRGGGDAGEGVDIAALDELLDLPGTGRRS